MAVRRRIVRKVRKVEDPNKAQKVAAAEAVCREIGAQYEPENAHPVDVAPYNYPFTVETKEGWRKLSLNQGHAMTWKGKVRGSAKGEVLFGFEPEMNSMLEERGAVLVEVAHTELETAFGPGFNDHIANMMGASIPELLEQALSGVDPEDEKRAAAVPEEPEPVIDASTMTDFGAWA